MELRETLTAAFTETLSMFGLAVEATGERDQASLTSVHQVNMLIGLTQALRGNVLLSCSRPTALQIASTMMGGLPVTELDPMARSALGELSNMVVASSVLRLQSDGPIQISPPTLIVGDRLFLLISRVAARALQFRVAAESFTIRYAIE